MAVDHYCYADSDVLISLLDARDPDLLQIYESLLTSDMAATAISFARSEPRIRFDTLCSVHYLLFGELYDWAGKTRTVAMSRNGIFFADPPYDINEIDRTVFEPFITSASSSGFDPIRFAERLGEVWSKLNYLHPFRDGNGRATQLLITALAEQQGYAIDWASVTRTMDNVAGMASQRGNHQGFIGILRTVLQPLANRPLASFWRVEGR